MSLHERYANVTSTESFEEGTRGERGNTGSETTRFDRSVAGSCVALSMLYRVSPSALASCRPSFGHLAIRVPQALRRAPRPRLAATLSSAFRDGAPPSRECCRVAVANRDRIQATFTATSPFRLLQIQPYARAYALRRSEATKSNKARDAQISTTFARPTSEAVDSKRQTNSVGRQSRREPDEDIER